jgi:hypothetical protein
MATCKCGHPENDHKKHGDEEHCIGLVGYSMREYRAAYIPARDICSCTGFEKTPKRKRRDSQALAGC